MYLMMMIWQKRRKHVAISTVYEKKAERKLCGLENLIPISANITSV